MPENASDLYARLWATKYAPLYAEQREVEQTRRAEAFVDGPRQVGPYLLRPITAYDLLLCDGYECPLTAGREAALELATPASVWWFAWLLQTEHPREDTRAKARFIAAQRRRHYIHKPRWFGLSSIPTDKPTPAYFSDLAAVLEFIESHFADSAAPRAIDPKTGQPMPSPERGTNWLAPLMVTLTCDMGPRDPVSDEPWAYVPLPRVWQYLRTLDQRATGKAADYSRSNRLRSECLAEVNAILAAS